MKYNIYELSKKRMDNKILLKELEGKEDKKSKLKRVLANMENAVIDFRLNSLKKELGI